MSADIHPEDDDFATWHTARPRFAVDEMTPGLYRVSLLTAEGHLITRRRDVAAERIDPIKAVLLSEAGIDQGIDPFDAYMGGRPMTQVGSDLIVR